MELDYFGLRIAKSAAEIHINISDSKLAFLEGNSILYALCPMLYASS